MTDDPQRPASDPRDELARRAHRTARRMRWAVRAVLALVVVLAALWVLTTRR